MSRTVIVDIPIGEHIAKCTIDLPTAAAASVGHHVMIATITNSITAAMQQLATFPMETQDGGKVRIKIEAQEDWLKGARTTCCYTVGRHEVLGDVLRAYAKFRGSSFTFEKSKFYFKNERFDGDYSSAADLKIESGDVIEAKLVKTSNA
ncbi:hypothetical protein LTR97_009939 [Elasticomyces elasticus]|uniref:Uncharacterized protein n=1 Tax=Elasticomyces elasticus TaxID=574655 RepID=A0AAN7VME2_9PEZI|nr:hypothetical protein LTR97_009939 [Elasticomyces elasticus]